MPPESKSEPEAGGDAETGSEANADSDPDAETELLEGYVIDNGCVRKNARDDLLESARTHTRECALMGHCVESGYSLVDVGEGIVGEGEGMAMLDAAATPKVVSAVRESDTEEGIRLRVERERRDGEMRTVSVDEVEP